MNVFSYKGVILLVLLIAAAFLFVSEINSNPLLLSFNPQNVGSFEYVRAGERFLDKGLYLKAISYYERAYEESSENVSIESNVIYAYSKYALALADSAKYDEAIEYLTKAYNVRQDPSTIQNLAIMYTRKALTLAQKKDFKKAMELFGEARRIAYGSYGAARNLGISLSNDGIVEFKQGRDDVALLCLKESSLIYQYGRTFSFLGDVYYKKGELRRALFCWHRARYLDPGDRSIPPKLKRVVKEIKLANSEREMELPHFGVKYKESLSIDANLAASILERAYFEIGEDLAYFPRTKTGVFFYSNTDFRNIFKMPAEVRAFYDGNIRMPIPDGRLGYEEFLRHVYHEYTHALLSAKTMNNCPVWFAEGIAMWEEFNRIGCNPKALPISTKTLGDTTLDSLDKEFDSNEIGPDRAICYLISYTVVAYIVNGWGIEGLQDILKRLADGQHVVNAIDDEFLLSEKEFERKWRAYVGSKYLLKFSNVP